MADAQVVKERPILFSAPMVRAILEGRKTQTRRLVKAPIDFIGAGGNSGPDWNDPTCWGWEDQENPGHFSVLSRKPEEGDWSIPCPYGKPGEGLWVRETWSPDHKDVYPNYPIVYRADGYPSESDISGGMLETGDSMVSRRTFFRWRPSIYMPRHLSRISLEITEIRVQRLEELSSEDAVAEGFAGWGQFIAAFYEINEHRCSVLDNPWVWAVSFKRI